MDKVPTIVTVASLAPGGEPVSYSRHPMGIIPVGFDVTTFLASLPKGSYLETEEDGSVVGFVRLPDGIHAVPTPEAAPAYSPVHPRDLSLTVAKDNADSSSVIFFSKQRLPLRFDQLQSPGDFIESEPIPVYLAHVLWSFVLRLTRGEGDKYAMSIESLGSHLSSRQDRRADAALNEPPGLVAPTILGALITLAMLNRPYVRLDFVDGGNDRTVLSSELSEQELCDLVAVNNELHMGVYITIDRSYFCLASIIDLKAKPTVSESTHQIVEAILRGEKPLGADLEITGDHRGAGDSSVYHVHKAALVSTSPVIKEALRTGGGATWVRLSEGGKRGTLVLLDDNALRMAIRIAYGLEVPLPTPGQQRMLLVVKQMHVYFGDHFTSVIAPQWEREICRRALALDTRNLSPSSMTDLLNLLGTIWDAPYGCFPVAKRVAIGVLADMVHFNARGSVDLFAWEHVQPAYESASGCRDEHLVSILRTMSKFLDALAGGTKYAGECEGRCREKHCQKPEVEKEKKEEVKPAIEKHSILIDMDEDEEEWHDANADIAAEPEDNTWTCTIS